MVILPHLRARVLQELHDTHPGTSKMKSLARQFVWWPRMDEDIEAAVQTCRLCQQDCNVPPKAPLYPWDWPRTP